MRSGIRTTMNYLTAHWRGQMSLAQSYWVNGVVVANVYTHWLVGLQAIAKLPSLPKTHPLAAAVVGMILLTVGVLHFPGVVTWQTMGIFRCARRVGGFWSGVAIVLYCVGWFAIVWQYWKVTPTLGVIAAGFFMAICAVAFFPRGDSAETTLPGMAVI
jgi:hypothetical protein